MRPRWQVTLLLLTLPIWFLPAMVYVGWMEAGRDIITKDVPVGGWLNGKLGLDVRLNVPLPEQYNLFIGVGTSDVVRMLDADHDWEPDSAQSRYGGQVFLGVRKTFGK